LAKMKEIAVIVQQVALAPVEPSDFPVFKSELQAAFALAVIDELGEQPEGPIPDDADLDKSLTAPNALVLHIMADGEQVGGAVVVIDGSTNVNRLDLFFIKVGRHGQGLGRRAWFALEAMFPESVAWETATPYFEKRNIHFYVNVCGFHIVEFWNDHHRDPNMPVPADMPGGNDMFRFVKQMKEER